MLAGASIVGASSVGAVAFTQASVEREVAVDIVADDSAPITLIPGATDAIELVNGVLKIDTNTSRASGLNGDGSFTFGDDADPGASGTHAFEMVNNGGGSRDFTFSLNNFALGGTSSSIKLSLYDDASPATSVGDVTTTSDVTGETLSSGDTLYAVLTFDTSGLNKTNDMNGDLKIDAVTTP